MKTPDPEFLEGSYAIFKQDFIAAPYPITKGLEATYDYVAQTRADIRAHKPEEFVDASFVAELDKSGFIKKLCEQRYSLGFKSRGAQRSQGKSEFLLDL